MIFIFYCVARFSAYVTRVPRAVHFVHYMFTLGSQRTKKAFHKWMRCLFLFKKELVGTRDEWMLPRIYMLCVTMCCLDRYIFSMLYHVLTKNRSFIVWWSKFVPAESIACKCKSVQPRKWSLPLFPKARRPLSVSSDRDSSRRPSLKKRREHVEAIMYTQSE